MRRVLNLTVITVLAVLLLVSISTVFGQEEMSGKQDRARTALQGLRGEFPNIKVYDDIGKVTRIYGAPFSFGSSPEASAEGFVQRHSAVVGAKSAQLVPESRMPDKRRTQQLMYDRLKDSYKFTLVYYRQYVDNVPVFRSELRLLVRNEPSYPLVLAVSSMWDVGDFRVPDRFATDFETAKRVVRLEMPEMTRFTDPTTKVWAGYDGVEAEQPRLALEFVGYGDNGEQWLFVSDAQTGEILYSEDRIIFEDVSGHVSGLGTEGHGAEHCEDEIDTPIPYAKVSIGATTAYTDENGNYTISNGGTGQVTVESVLKGQYFNVYNYAGSDVGLSSIVTPPGPADFQHNTANTDPLIRAQVNGYIEPNEIRDLVIEVNPSYPQVSTQSNFPVYVNRNDFYCPGNAWYDPGDVSINFCQEGSGHPNTAWSSVIHHEYGHHLVNVGGSGQGEYGEGTSDIMSLLLSDSPELGLGFYGSCSEALRNADNTFQYPCSGAIHYCGQLYSGCVWSTRNELIGNYPNYITILADLSINSILLHTGTSITPQITIDWLTLDDDDANLDNGTPHYPEICAGFGAHNMDCPELSPILFEYPNGRPQTVMPNQTTTVEVVINDNAVAPTPGSGQLFYSIDGAPYVSGTMTETSPDHYDAILPAADCESVISWYVTAEASGFGTVSDPADAPSSAFTTIVATSFTNVIDDNFESDQGWTTSYSGATSGYWQRGTPVNDGSWDYDPASDGDGSGQCFLTENTSGNTDVDNGSVTLISPTLDMANGIASISYYYFLRLTNTDGTDKLLVEISSNGLSGPWTQIANHNTDGGLLWRFHEIDAAALSAAGVTMTSDMRVRFTANDGDPQSINESGVDGFTVNLYECDDQTDTDGDGIIDILDNCPIVSNPEQEDTDADGIGNLCDVCPDVYNPNQEDADSDGIGDSCDVCTDSDGDGFGDPGFPHNTCDTDNCPNVENADQADADGDGIGDACDHCTDTDGDGYGDPGYTANNCDEDNCPSIANEDQADADGDGIGDVCDECTDTDGDGYGNPGYAANTCDEDNCPTTPNEDQLDSDEDGAGDVCDDCPDHPEDDCCDPQFHNQAPTISSESYIGLEPGEEFSYTATANDNNCDGTELTFSVENLPSWCSLTDVTVTGTAGCDHEDTLFTVIVSDGSLNDTLLVTIDIDHSNVPPSIAEVDDEAMYNGSELMFVPVVTDPDDTEITLEFLSVPAWSTVQNDTVTGTVPDARSTETISVAAHDFCGSDTMSFVIETFVCGDVDESEGVDIDDIVYVIQYVFQGGADPVPPESGDVNCSDSVDIDDVVYIIEHVFQGGADPCADCD